MLPHVRRCTYRSASFRRIAGVGIWSLAVWVRCRLDSRANLSRLDHHGQVLICPVTTSC